ncbi:hypothetical protein L7F22_034378 [Adiantum nelumboides]|nr:hypothetical protein [Adiantum nelumboides]
MGKGRKKRTTRNGDVVDDKQAAAGSSHVAHEVAPVSFNAEKSSILGASQDKTGSTFYGESSFSAMPRSSSSEPCRYFQRGFCWYGDECRFQHSEGPSTAPPVPTLSTGSQHPPRPASNSFISPHSVSKPFNPQPKSSAPFNPNPKAPRKKERSPEECLDWYLTGTCPRLGTCRYAHPRNVSLSSLKDEVLGNRKTSGKGYDDFGFLGNSGLGRGSFDVDDNAEMGYMMGNCGFTDDDVYELSLQGIKPWDPEAGAALAVLNGWDMDDGFGYGYEDYDYY